MANIVIMGAAGRDFHNFNVHYRERPQHRVVAFTAAQIPNIAGRRYPAELAGPGYPEGIPIVPEEELERTIAAHSVDEVTFAYSDISYAELMHRAGRAMSAGASFGFLGPNATMLEAAKPVVAVCAVRTGAGKSPVVRSVVRALSERGRRPGVVRHPMPYGDLRRQVCQRFATLRDLQEQSCTIEEREEYEPHIAEGTVVYAGVDYGRVLARAEEEADVIVWDGGNNDLPFFRPTVHVVVADALRPGHELAYYPSETNVRLADALIVNKVDVARVRDVETVRSNLASLNPGAAISEGILRLSVPDGGSLQGTRALVIEDGPTITHGGMDAGAGLRAAERFGARPVDPRAWAAGSLAEAYQAYPHIGPVLPALGYSDEQLRELGETVRAVPCDVVVIASPVDLRRLIDFDRPAVRVTYAFEVVGGPVLDQILAPVLEGEGGP